VRNSSSRQFVGNDKAFKGCLKAISELENFRQKQFKDSNDQALIYFKNVYLVFIQRIFEWSIIPEMNIKRYKILKTFLQENHFFELIKETSKNYKFFDKSYVLFFSYIFLKKKYNRALTFMNQIKKYYFLKHLKLYDSI
jgi:hypothetical protein